MDGRPPALVQDASIEAVPPKSRAAFAGASARAKVGVISAAHGNFVSEFTGEDLRQLGLNPGDRMMVEANGRSFEALWGTKYGDVPEGKGVVFVTGDGLLCIARNFANAAAFLGVKEGDEVTIRRKPDEGAAGR
jgi:S-adenosylmethionine hydrolase